MMVVVMAIHSVDSSCDYVQYFLGMRLDKYSGAKYGILAQASLRLFKIYFECYCVVIRLF